MVRRAVRFSLALAIGAAVLAGASHQSATAAGPAPPFTPRVGHIGGIVPAPSLARSDVGPLGGGNLTWHGGSVMHTNTTYAIYWFPAGYPLSSQYSGTINQYFQDLAADSGKQTNVYATDPQYTDSTGHASYDSTFGGWTQDTNSFPASGCSSGFSRCLTDVQLQTEISRVVSAHGWPRNDHTEYFLFTPSGVTSCFDSFSGQCAYTYFCAYHGYSTLATGGRIVYANEPWSVPNCDEGQYPNGSGSINPADPTINTVSHEHNEAITDPYLNAWYDDQGYEDGDKCAWIFDGYQGPYGGLYTNTIDTHNYWLQLEWDNSA